MMLNILFILIGLSALIAGAEALVRGAGGIALMAHITPSVAALTVVAAGTSMPELVVSLQAALGGNPGLSLGNAVGSNFLNIALVLGFTALIRPMLISGRVMRFEWPVLMTTTLLFFFLSRDGSVDRLEGAFLSGILIIFMSYAVFLDKQKLVKISPPDKSLKTASFGQSGFTALLLNILAAGAGVALLAGGANILVKGASGMAAALGVPDTIIGLTVVAVGTSAPELVTSIVAAARGRGDMALGNLIGSCIFNLTGILGITALVRPLPVPGGIIHRDMLWLMAFSALLFPMMLSGKKINRAEGGLLLSGYVVYTVLLIQGI